MKIVTEVWPQQREKWKPLLHLYWKDLLLYEKADSVILRMRIEKFYFYNCERIVLQTDWPEWSDFSFVVITDKQNGYFTPGFLRLFAALLLKAHHQKTLASCLPSPASNMLCGATLNKGWWNDKNKWRVFNHPLWKWTGMRSTPGWSDI